MSDCSRSKLSMASCYLIRALWIQQEISYISYNVAMNIIEVRGKIFQRLYTGALKPALFRLDPELVHDRISSLGVLLGTNLATRTATKLSFAYQNAVLRQTIQGIRFANPIGLAAGFDKNAKLTQILPSVGFGWMEVGSITARLCAGNNGKRLHRLPKSKSLVVNYGLMNDGVDAVLDRLKNLKFEIPVGTSIAPTNDQEAADYRMAIEDYSYSYQQLAHVGSYTTLNLSCPNTCHDQPFVDPKKLDELLMAVKKIPTHKPIFIKLSPDLAFAAVDELLTVAKKYGVAGVICTNLTKKRDPEKIKDGDVPERGGLSGGLVREQSDALISHVFKTWGNTFTIVGCGGVFSAEDAYRKIRLGASLIQLITGMVYEGPQLIGQINQGLVELLHRDGFNSISEAVGMDV